MSNPRLLYVILDGLGDDPLDALDGRTPLEAARTPRLDSLATKGVNGYVTTVGEGIAPESDIAVLAVLGYDPFAYHTGRGPLEAVGAGLDVRPGDLAYRVNFATVRKDDDGWEIVDRRVGRDLGDREAKSLAAEVQEKALVEGASFDFRATVGHRGALVLRSTEGELAADVENSDPAYGREGLLGVAKEEFEDRVVRVTPVAGNESDPGARRAARITNDWLAASFEVLSASSINKKREEAGKLAGNFVLTRDAGDRLPDLPPFEERFGIKMGCFVEMPVEMGIARLTGMGVIEAPTGIPPGEQYQSWASLAAEAIADFGGLYIHIKGPDVPAHDRDHRAKIESIERIDEDFFEPLLHAIDLADIVVAVTADHSTSCARGAHTDGPVPLLISGGAVESDGVNVFSEASSCTGSLGHLRGTDIVPTLLKLMRRT
ncbi:MAG: alkaline phosphatase family protein [Actinomycetota bacterium]